MKIKQNYLKISVILAALALLTHAYPAMAGEQVPFKGVEVGGASGGPFEFPIATIFSTAEGEATHLGHFTETGTLLVNVLSSFTTGILTITVANGDMLFITSEGYALQPPSLKETEEIVTVTGGTGRFLGATGSWVKHTHFDFLFGTISPDPFVALLEGTISTPGANKK